jgi:rare lipoprotein A
LKRLARAAWILLPLLAQACVTTTQAPSRAVVGEGFSGLASWYGQEFAGRTTANGEIFDPLLLSAAHRTLPFGTVLHATNPKNGKSVDVRINDRGPFVGDRVVDLSYAAAQQLGLTEEGVGQVNFTITAIGAGDREPPRPYVVTIPHAAQAANPPPPDRPAGTRKTVESAPPEVDFPLPPDAAPVAATTTGPTTGGDQAFHVEVVEEHQGPTARTVAPGGKSIIEPVTPAPPPSRSVDRGAAAVTTWVVQLGAFAVEGNARLMRDRVAKLVEHTYVEPGAHLFRVRVGPFATRGEALEARQKLEGGGISGVVMTSDAR